MARILLTGASSFTGLWIAEALARAGHEVVATLTRGEGDYPGLRGERVARLAASTARVFDAPLDSDLFRDLARTGRFDLFAHHGADIPGYRSPDYDVAAGVARNLAGAEAAVKAAASGGCRVLVSTATVFEPGEGGEGPEAPAVSPYGLSKGLTGQALADFAEGAGLSFGRFVIANPFGVLEEGRMGWSLFQAWFRGEPGRVLTPAYVRDNQPVPDLACAYAGLAGHLLAAGPGGNPGRLRPATGGRGGPAPGPRLRPRPERPGRLPRTPGAGERRTLPAPRMDGGGLLRRLCRLLRPAGDGGTARRASLKGPHTNGLHD